MGRKNILAGRACKGAVVLIGAIADDITGATDLALMLARAGLRVVQVIGLPDGPLPDAEAVVVALKSRTIPADQAVAMSLAAARALQAAGAQQLLFKYCSTFDSTDAGNIGPVAQALLDLTGADLTIFCPSFPANGRTVYQGHLFVGAHQLLSDSPMKDHPLTPMRDANLVRVLGRQTALPVGLLPMGVVAQGVAAVQAALAEAEAAGTRISGGRCADRGGFADAGRCLRGDAAGHGRVWHRDGVGGCGHGWARADGGPKGAVCHPGRVMLAGHAGQIAAAQAAGMPSLAVDVVALGRGAAKRGGFGGLGGGAAGHGAGVFQCRARRPCPYPDGLGRDRAGALVEQCLADLAHALQSRGIHPVHHRGRRNIGRGGGGFGGDHAGDRARNRPRRALDTQRCRGTHRPRPEIRQFRRASVFPEGVGYAGGRSMSDLTQARDEIARVGQSLFDRGLTPGSSGNISVRLADGGWLMTPDQHLSLGSDRPCPPVAFSMRMAGT